MFSCGWFRVSHSALSREGGISCMWPHKAGSSTNCLWRALSLFWHLLRLTWKSWHQPAIFLLVLDSLVCWETSQQLSGSVHGYLQYLQVGTGRPGRVTGGCSSKMGWEPSRGLWPSPWLRAGPALKIKQVLQSFLFSQAWWLSSSARQPPFVQKCPCVKVLPWLLGHFQPDSVR